ncbi:heme-binding domain-containing protein [Chryseobacterium manosquense]|uniref:Cytochrome C n=2 Tax=Chryseobacterium group TaxID=2782232 RepID=A0A246BB76_9FLAO|nr:MULTISPECIES: heme-binding domain-containing protein [Chryseobacterium group]OWK98932.1 cytochrome C [Kaistella haifensis DSM 19056]QNS40131.1 heme-binding domain-containing protein [Chryseobacterium manosquense]ROI07237.1 cytochrome C [Kaistella haifensis]
MKKILVILLVAFILIQFFPIDKNNPAPTPQMDFLTIKNTPESTAKLIRNGCYDCHSNESKYPWYSNFQPVAWFLKDHIDEGRRKLNFSTFATYEPKRQAHKLFEAIEMVEKDEMPLDSYTIIHSEAKYTEAQKQEVLQYFKKIENDIRTTHNLAPEQRK